MATRWTDEQQAAIENKGGTLLVSAAAGSGKTAVLVERVLQRLTDAVAPKEIDQFLMITYTNAAAAELRGKLSDALTARLAATPDDARLRRQLFLVHRAQITTVHAFCLGIAREQFATLGIAPDFRIADPNEAGLLMDETLDAALEIAYEEGDPKFLALSDLLTTGRDDKRLHEVVLETYDKIQAHPLPHAFLEQVRQGFAVPCADTAQTAHGKVLLHAARQAAAYGASCLMEAIEALAEGDALTDAYMPALKNDLVRAERLLGAIDKADWDGALYAAREITFDRLGAARGYEDKAHMEDIKALREEWKSAAARITEKLLCVTAAEAEDDRVSTAPAMFALADVTERFTQAFTAEKRRRNLVDFNDLEHFAIGLLMDATGSPTPLANTMSQRFCEVLVDEYQDTNAVQDAIFSTVSAQGARLFMVGDVKQSIYSFRLANPHIFLGKYRAYHDADVASAGEARRIVLSKNFRSRTQVLDGVNAIFRAVMSHEAGDLDYDEREMLYPGASFPDEAQSCYKTELHVIDCAKDAQGNQFDKTQSEARAVAARIQKLLAEGLQIYDKALGYSRAASSGDCTILLRSVKKKAAIYRKALEEVGLSARTDDSAGLLAAVEVRVMVSLLGVIDNPRQDVELIGVLRSPLIGFTEQKLAEIHLCSRKACFYDALCVAAETDCDTAEFLQRLERWRLLAADLPVNALVRLLYDETSALGLYGALQAGAQRQANLLAFFERARAYEAQGYRGLFQFMELIRGMLSREEDFVAPQNESGGGAVRIMSVHKSKGLEFPVVILADCAKSFNESDLYAPVLVHDTLGFGPKRRDAERGVQYPTLQRLAIAAQARHDQVSEEMRILYVGMTRARDKLIIMCSSASAVASLKKWARLAVQERIPAYALSTARTTALWLLTPLLRHPAANALRDMAGVTITPDINLPDCFEFLCMKANEIIRLEAAQDADEDKSCTEQIAVPIQPRYKAELLQLLPAKVTATGVKQGYKAEEAAALTVAPRTRFADVLRRPYFDQQARGLTPSEVGTAHHLFMQFCDFTACELQDGVKNERIRLAERHILSAEQAQAIEIDRIDGFFQSEIYRSVLKKGDIRREFKFSILAPAARFYPEAENMPEERVLLQGVVDCIIETEDGFIVVDYKTDRVNTKSAQARAESYRAQLEVYAYAAQEIYQKPVIKKMVYFFATKQWIQL